MNQKNLARESDFKIKEKGPETVSLILVQRLEYLCRHDRKSLEIHFSYNLEENEDSEYALPQVSV